MIIEHFFSNRDALFLALTETCVDLLKEQARSDEAALAYLSGGSTPQPLYRRLASSDIDFSAIHWAMVDERWVDYNDEGSNERFIDESFAGAKGFSLVPMKNSNKTPKAGLPDIESVYGDLPVRSTFCVLGMGLDGHTASFFPGAAGLYEALATDNNHKVSAIVANRSAITGDHVQRVTLTLNTILNCQYLVLLITGDDKLRVYQQAIKDGSLSTLPISSVLRQKEPAVHVYWSP